MPERYGDQVILVDHDVELVSAVCDEIAVLDFGKVIGVGATDEDLADDEVKRAYLGDEVLLSVLAFSDVGVEREAGHRARGLAGGAARRDHRPLGPNGAGKSSLVLAIAGVLPLSGGKIRAAEKELGRRPDQVRRAGVSTVPEGHRVLTDLSVAENLGVAAGRLGRRERQPRLSGFTSSFRRSESWARGPRAVSPAASNRCWPSRRRCSISRGYWSWTSCRRACASGDQRLIPAIKRIADDGVVSC